MIRSIEEVYRAIQSAPPKTVAVAQAADLHVLQAVRDAQEEGLIRAVLVGDPAAIRAAAAEGEIDLAPFAILPAADAQEAAALATGLVHDGKADFLMKGLLESSTFLKAILHREYGLRKAGAVISAIAVVQLPTVDRLVFLTDLAITPVPDLETKVKILENAVAVARQFGVETPKVAVLSAAETVNPKLTASQDAAVLADMCRRGQLGDCLVAGPISFDLAMSHEATVQKGYSDPVAGDADILQVPSIEVGNVLYKALMLFGGIRTGGIIAGTRAPVVFCSRADSPETKKNTIALAAYMASGAR